MTFKAFHLYELHKNTGLPYIYVLCICRNDQMDRPEIKNFTFLPIVPSRRRQFRDDFRVPVKPEAKGGSARIPRMMYVAVDAITSIGKAAVLSNNCGRLTVNEEQEVQAALDKWLV